MALMPTQEARRVRLAQRHELPAKDDDEFKTVRASLCMRSEPKLVAMGARAVLTAGIARRNESAGVITDSHDHVSTQ